MIDQIEIDTNPGSNQLNIAHKTFLVIVTSKSYLIARKIPIQIVIQPLPLTQEAQAFTGASSKGARKTSKNSSKPYQRITQYKQVK